MTDIPNSTLPISTTPPSSTSAENPVLPSPTSSLRDVITISNTVGKSKNRGVLLNSNNIHEEEGDQALQLVPNFADDIIEGRDFDTSGTALDFLAKYCILNDQKLSKYRKIFNYIDSNTDGYIDAFELVAGLGLVTDGRVLLSSPLLSSPLFSSPLLSSPLLSLSSMRQEDAIRELSLVRSELSQLRNGASHHTGAVAVLTSQLEMERGLY